MDILTTDEEAIHSTEHHTPQEMEEYSLLFLIQQELHILQHNLLNPHTSVHGQR